MFELTNMLIFLVYHIEVLDSKNANPARYFIAADPINKHV
jgi:hypothetical protein